MEWGWVTKGHVPLEPKQWEFHVFSNPVATPFGYPAAMPDCLLHLPPCLQLLAVTVTAVPSADKKVASERQT